MSVNYWYNLLWSITRLCSAVKLLHHGSTGKKGFQPCLDLHWVCMCVEHTTLFTPLLCDHSTAAVGQSLIWWTPHAHAWVLSSASGCMPCHNRLPASVRWITLCTALVWIRMWAHAPACLLLAHMIVIYTWCIWGFVLHRHVVTAWFDSHLERTSDRRC